MHDALPARTRLPGLLALFLVLLLAVPAAGNAQTSLTLQAGASFASLEGDDAGDEFETTTGLAAGASLSFPLGEMFAVSPGLYYVQKGTKAPENGGELELSLDYLEIPLLGVVRITGADQPVGISLFVGPEVAFEVGCSFDFDDGDVEESLDCDDEGVDSDERRKVDFGAIFGGGVTFGVGGMNLVANFGLDLGLRSLDDSVEENDVKNSAWFLMGGLVFPLGR